MNFDIKSKQDWKYRKATADMLRLTRAHRHLLASEKHVESAVIMFVCMFLCGFILISGCQTAHAYTEDEIVNAIGKAENSKTHPYGIMVKYRHTSPKKACLNTVRT